MATVSLRYSGPAVLRTDSGAVFDVEAALHTNMADGTYSWGGRLCASDIAALGVARRGGTLTLPGLPGAEVHVVVADPDPAGGVLLRVNGHGRAPYEQGGEQTAERTREMTHEA